jgi:Ca2+-transporting ATPase
VAEHAPRLREIPFDPQRRRMTVVVRAGDPDLARPFGDLLAVVKGAPSEVVARCERVLQPGGPTPLPPDGSARALAEAERLAGAGDRVVAVAARAAPEGTPDEALERELCLLGFLAVRDPPRPTAAAALARCREAGIRVVMVTGDGPATALAVARETGLADAGARALTGGDVDGMDDEALRALLAAGQDRVFARVTPPQKLRLVRAFQALGEVVAVTGDGVNDAPALRAAHVGVAMGASGTDVAREAADLVLLDDDLGCMVAAVEEGRALFRNIRKFLGYILTSNVPEIVPFLAMVTLRIPPALTILQILAVDLGTDMVPALALGGEPPEPGLMRRPPRRRDAPLLDARLLRRAYLRLGPVQAAACMAAFAGTWLAAGVGLHGLREVAPAILAHAGSPEIVRLQAQATTAALAAIVACQVGNLFAFRSERLSAFAVRGRNPLLFVGLAVEVVVLLAVVFLPPLQRVFGTAPPPPLAWPLLLVGPAALLLVDEGVKAAGRRATR